MTPLSGGANARINAAGSICGSDKFSMTSGLIPLAFNELLDRPRIVSFNNALSFPASLLNAQLSCDAKRV
jgi:hypothetical protein